MDGFKHLTFVCVSFHSDFIPFSFLFIMEDIDFTPGVLVVGPKGTAGRTAGLAAPIGQLLRVVPSSLMYAAAQDVGAVPMLPLRDPVTEAGRRLTRAQQANPRFMQTRNFVLQGGIDMFTAMRRIITYKKRNREVLKTKASLILFIPYEDDHHTVAASLREDGDRDGMPAAQARAFVLSNDFPEAVRGLLRHHFGNGPAGAPLPNRFRLRIDWLFTTADAGDEDAEEPKNGPQALMGDVLVDVPRMWPSPPAYHVCTPQTLTQTVRDIGASFFDHVDNEMRHERSNRILRTLVACYIFAAPTLDAVGGGMPLYNGLKVRGRAAFAAFDGLDVDSGAFLVPLPEALFNSRGIVLNNPGVPETDKRCLARAIVTALYGKVACRSDSELLPILDDAKQGFEAREAELKLRHARYLAWPGSVGKASVIARMEAQIAAVKERQVALQAERSEALALYARSGRHIRPEVFSSEAYKTRSCWPSIERDLASAFDGRHPLVSFKDPFFSTGQPLTAETFSRMQTCALKIPGTDLPAVKIQVWCVGQDNKIGVVYPAKGATLDYLKKGGRVVQLLFAHSHVSTVANVSASCNSKGTSKLERVYCGLCGYHTARSGGKLRIWEHQRRGCPRFQGVEFPLPLSYTNRRMLGKWGTRARNRPLMLAFLDVSGVYDDETSTFTEADACLDLRACVPRSAHTPLSYTPFDLCDTEEAWTSFRRRWGSYAQTADHGVVAASIPRPERPHVHSTMAEVLSELARTPSVDNLLDQLHYCGPKMADRVAAVADLPPSSPCYFCRMPCNEISAWRRMKMPSEEVDADTDEEEERADTDEESDATVSTTTEAVQHHCHGTGDVYLAHPDCNTIGYQSSSLLAVEVGSAEAMACCVGVLFSRAFIDEHLRGKPPHITAFQGNVTRVTFKLFGTERGLYKHELAALRLQAEEAGREFDADAAAEERRPRILTVMLRPRTAFSPDRSLQPTALERVRDQATTTIAWAEKQFVSSCLYPLYFGTAISYARARFFDDGAVAFPPGVTPTSIVTREGLAFAKRILTGGRLVMGDAVSLELSPAAQTTRDEEIIIVDYTGQYPSKLKGLIPSFEHEFAPVVLEPADREAPLAFLERIDLYGSHNYVVEVSGAFPPHLHARLGRFPPVYSKREIFGRDLSAFQRVSLGIDVNKSIGMRSVAHFFPLENEVVWLRTLRIWLRLGFVVTRIGAIWSVPQAAWGRPFAASLEKQRQDATASGQKSTADFCKLLANSVLGSLAIDKSRYTSYAVEKNYAEGGDAAAAAGDTESMTRSEKYADNPAWTLVAATAGDCTLYEKTKTRWAHENMTLVFTFIQAMARDDLVELFWGTDETPNGLVDIWPDVQVSYGATDSLAFKISLSDQARELGFKDVRQEFWWRFADRLDVSNVPSTSSFLDFPPDMPHQVRMRMELARDMSTRNVGVWGKLKSQTGMCRVNRVFINGPNRWGYECDQDERDTPADCRRATLKSVPKTWMESKDPPTLAEFSRSFEEGRLPDVSRFPAPSDRVKASTANFGAVCRVNVVRRHLSVWANTACIVEADPPFRHFPLGTADPLALEAAARPFAPHAVADDGLEVSPKARSSHVGAEVILVCLPCVLQESEEAVAVVDRVEGAGDKRKR